MEKLFPVYKALDEHEIRVLELEPGCGDAAIVFSLRHVSLRGSSSSSSYEAISYVWGDGNDLHPILHHEQSSSNEPSDPKTVTVTRNLRDALQHFRDPNNQRIIWADALCINQQNSSERAHQVRLMGEVYTKADRVLLWLGLADEDTAAAVEYLGDVSKYCLENTTLLELERVNVMGELAQRLNIDQLPQFDQNGALAAMKLFKRPWFRRIWVVQEVAAGQDVIVLIGHYKIPFLYIGLGATWLRESRFSETTVGAGDISLRNASIMWQKRFGARVHPADLLDDGRDLLATDPRDKVYGLLGFNALQNVVGIEVAYDEPVEKVYTKTSLAIIKSTGDLDVLSFADGPGHVDEPATPSDNLRLGWPDTPSWVARWDEETWFPTSAMCGLSPHKQRIGPPAAISVADAEAGILTVEGQMLDTVVYVAPYIQWPETPDAEPRPINPRVFLDMWIAISSRVKVPEAASLLRAWAQVLTGGITASYQPAQENPEAHCADLVAFLLDTFATDLESEKGGSQLYKFYAMLRTVELTYPRGDRTKFQMAMVLLLTYRRIFVTASGYLGLGHSRVRDGDIVVWLFGGRLPFVLRGNGEHWNYVGEGFMYNVSDERMHSYEGGVEHENRVFELR